MPTSLTPEQVLALAPDPGSANSGKGLATPRKWLTLGQSERAAWGECKGSGQQPYQTQIDLTEPAFRCSCPSRKFPCKHGLGLLLMLAGNATALPEAEPPAWVTEWLGKRDQSAQQRQARQTARAAEPDDPQAQARRASQQAKTAATRESRVAEGVAELERWLRDLVRRGLASLSGNAYRFSQDVAARMVDAQAPGLGRMLRELSGIPASGDGWQGRLLERLARIHLLTSSYRRLAELPPDTQADVRSAIGWTQNQGDLTTQPGLPDRWLVLGQRIAEEENLRVQRTWLWGEQSARAALVLDFAMAGQMLDRSLVPGTVLEAELVFFPSNLPQRAVVKQRATPERLLQLPGQTDLTLALADYAAALSRNPWLERFPLLLREVTPTYLGEGWSLRDAAGRCLPIAEGFAQGWRLLALSGGYPLALFGEWDGDALWPLSVQVDQEVRLL